MWTTRKSQRLSLTRRANGLILLFICNFKDNNVSTYKWKVGLLKYFGNIVSSHRYRSSASMHITRIIGIIKETDETAFGSQKIYLRKKLKNQCWGRLWELILVCDYTIQCLMLHTIGCSVVSQEGILRRFNVTYYWRQTSFFV